MAESERTPGATGTEQVAKASFLTRRSYEITEDRLARSDAYQAWSERHPRMPWFIRLVVWALVSKRFCDRYVPIAKERFRRAQGVDVRSYNLLILNGAMLQPSLGREAIREWAEMTSERVKHHTEIMKAVADG